MEELEDSKVICADTDILIDFLKRKDPGSRAYEHWKGKSSVSITSITAFELLLGARLPNRKEKRLDEAKSLVEQHHVLPFDKSAAEKASEIGIDLGREGKGIEIRDLFNASICVTKAIPILTRNKDHYQRVKGLELLDL